MADKKTNLSAFDPASVPDAAGLRFVLIAAEWNPEVTQALLRGARGTLLKHGVKPDHIETHHVPGSYELPQAARLLIEARRPDAVICLGCVIQGETRHFEFISQAVAQGITQVGVETGTPVIFGVLTTDNMDQALQRAGGKHGNKGDEAALSAIMMARMKTQLEKDKP